MEAFMVILGITFGVDWSLTREGVGLNSKRVFSAQNQAGISTRFRGFQRASGPRGMVDGGGTPAERDFMPNGVNFLPP
jgi:hypothetical protein